MAPSGFRCAGNFRTMEDALTGIARDQAQTSSSPILGCPGWTASKAHAILRDRFPDVPILALTVYDDDENVFNAICAGASGTC